jgi:hypothetical protein
MKVWVIECRGHEGDAKTYWGGGDFEGMTTDLSRAVWFVRQFDAHKTLDFMPLFRGKPVEVEGPTEGLVSTRGDRNHGASTADR